MALSILRNGVPLDQLYGTKGASTAAATGCLQNGVDVNQYLLALADGKALGFNSGLSKNGTDFSAIFGTPNTNTPLGMNGKTYTRGAGRGTHYIRMQFFTAGTWTVVDDSGGTLDTGSWLIFGGAASDYTVQYVMSGFSNGPDPDGGSNSFSNDASSQVNLGTTQPIANATSSATVLNTSAANYGTVTINLYKSGVLVSTSVCTFDVSAAG